MKQPNQVRDFRGFLRVDNGRLEGWRHLVLDYLHRHQECTVKSMSTQVRSCTKCFQLMWLKADQYELLDEETVRAKCPHCGATVRFPLVTTGPNALGPKMGH